MILESESSPVSLNEKVQTQKERMGYIMNKKFERLETLCTILWSGFNALATAYLAMYVEACDLFKFTMMVLIWCISAFPLVYLKYVIYLCTLNERKRGAHEIRQ